VRTNSVLLLSVSPPSECDKNAIVVGNKVLLYCYWPCDLDLHLWPLNPKTVSLLGYPKDFFTPSLNTLGSFVFQLCCGQTDKQIDSKILPTPTDRVGVGNQLTSVTTIVVVAAAAVVVSWWLIWSCNNHLFNDPCFINCRNRGMPTSSSWFAHIASQIFVLYLQ